MLDILVVYGILLSIFMDNTRKKEVICMLNQHPEFIQMREVFRLKYIHHRNASNKSVEDLAKEQAFKSVLDYMDQNPVYVRNTFTKAEDFLRTNRS